MKKHILVLGQFGDKLKIICNCYKLQYDTLIYFPVDNPKDIHEQKLTGQYAILTDLSSGDYYLYCKNASEETIGHTTITILNTNKELFFDNVLNMFDFKNDKNIVDFLSNIKSDDYFVELYKKIVSTEDEAIKNKYELILEQLCAIYNIRQELFNNDAYSFSFDQSIGCKIYENNDLPVKFLPNAYSIDYDSYILDRNNVVYDKSLLSYNYNSCSLMRISIIDDFSMVREYLYYSPSKNAAMTKYEANFSLKAQIEEQISNIQLEDIETSSEHDQKVLIGMYNVLSQKKIFMPPELVVDKDILSICINDYDFLELFNKDIYIAAIDVDEAYKDNFNARKIKITEQQFNINLQDYFFYKDEDYICFVTDDNNTILSDPIIIRYSDETDNINTINDQFKKVLYEDYRNELEKIFDAKHIDGLGEIINEAEHWLTSQHQETLYEFLLAQLVTSNTKLYDNKDIIKAIILAYLDGTKSFKLDYMNKRVYRTDSKIHVIPESNPYILEIIKMNKNSYDVDRSLQGTDAKEISVKNSEITLIRCIDPITYTSSPIAMYCIKDNNVYTDNLVGLEIQTING